MLGQGETIKDFQHRFPILFGVLVGLFGLMLLRLGFLQIYRGQEYRMFSERNSLRQEKLPGPRGLILDRDGRVLVDNRLRLNITVTPQYVSNMNEVLGRISELSGEPFERLRDRYRSRVTTAFKFQPVSVVDHAPWPLVVQVESKRHELPGVEVEPAIRRHYLHKQVGAHVYGYLSEVTRKDLESERAKRLGFSLGDWVGTAGLERVFDEYLRGQNGVRYVEVDAHGHRVDRSEEGRSILRHLPADIPPKPGHNLLLTIDERLQLVAAEAMKGMLGGTVAIDPRTGEVLAMISAPTFDPTELSEKRNELWASINNNPFRPLVNKNISDHYPSGSTFKVFTALAALEEKIIDQKTTVFCPGSFRFGRRVYHCHKEAGHGHVDLLESLRGSCDVFFYSIASKMGIDPISRMASLFGLGRETQIELDREVPGLMPTEGWKLKALKEEWTPGETLSASIGQGYNLVTPLQMAVSYATLVNGGNLYKPYLVSGIESVDGKAVKRFSPELLSNHKVNAEFLTVVKEAMAQVVNHPNGTAYHFARSPNVTISGKSGTAQVVSMTKEELFSPCDSLPLERRHHAWFVGFAPRDNPEIVVSVLGLHECGGSRRASPVVKSVIEEWYKNKKLKEALQGPSPANAKIDLDDLEWGQFVLAPDGDPDTEG